MEWATRTFHHSQFPPERLRAERTQTVSVCVPAREEASTIAGIVTALVELQDAGVIDQVVVVDADSADGTAAIAAEHGAEVHSQEALMPAFGPVLGKGDAMWRALSVLDGELVCFLDADTENFDPRFPCGTLGPLICEPGVEFVKGCFRRPLKLNDVTHRTGGGRVTALTARPLLDAFFPELSGMHQPLAGEMAASRELLASLPFATGYAVEMSLLLDVYAGRGASGLAQVDLDVRQNRHQSLESLAGMAAEVLSAVTSRLTEEGRLSAGTRGVPVVRRPPLSEVIGTAAADPVETGTVDLAAPSNERDPGQPRLRRVSAGRIHGAGPRG